MLPLGSLLKLAVAAPTRLIQLLVQNNKQQKYRSWKMKNEDILYIFAVITNNFLSVL